MYTSIITFATASLFFYGFTISFFFEKSWIKCYLFLSEIRIYLRKKEQDKSKSKEEAKGKGTPPKNILVSLICFSLMTSIYY